MSAITIYPKSKEEISLFKYLAEKMNTPYKIIEGKTVQSKVKPSDFFNTLSVEVAKKMHKQLSKSRNEWERDI